MGSAKFSGVALRHAPDTWINYRLGTSVAGRSGPSDRSPAGVLRLPALACMCALAEGAVDRSAVGCGAVDFRFARSGSPPVAMRYVVSSLADAWLAV